jgi:hypothetical protein
MSELDAEALEGVRAWAQRRVDWVDRQRRMAPLYEAMDESNRILMTKITPDLMAGPRADSRRALLTLEKSVAAFPQRMMEQERKYEANLARVRRRTEALRAWLEALA